MGRARTEHEHPRNCRRWTMLGGSWPITLPGVELGNIHMPVEAPAQTVSATIAD